MQDEAVAFAEGVTHKAKQTIMLILLPNSYEDSV